MADHQKAWIGKPGRPVFDRGQFTSCRHHSSTDADRRTFRCSRSGKTKASCEGCKTCPKCNSPLFTCALIITEGRDQVYAEHAKGCVICGAYIEETLKIPKIRIREHKGDDACQVTGCKHTAYEGYQHTEEVDGQPATFRICLAHKRRIKTWRYHQDKGEDQKPIIIVLGHLVDNPEYNKKQGKRREAKDEAGL